MEKSKEQLKLEHRSEDKYMAYYVMSNSRSKNHIDQSMTDDEIIDMYYDFCQEVLGVPWDGERFGQFVDYLQSK